MTQSIKNNQVRTFNPQNGELLNTYDLMTDIEAIEAVEKCQAAFEKWKMETPSDRAKVIAAIGKKLKEHKESLASLMTTEMGKLLRQSHTEIDLCVGICEYTSTHAPQQLESEERDLPSGGRGIVAYRPLGVIYGIQPWNFPAYQVLRYAIANLMAGNGVLLKHAENVTGTGLRIKEILEEAGVPKDLFTVLVIDHDQSDKIISHDLVRGVTLTGSPGAGRIIAEKAGKEIKKTVLELGSNDAYVVLADADLEVAVKQCVIGRTFNNGETCVAAKRFVVVDEIYEEFEKAFVAKMADLKFGDPTLKESKLGPIAREDLRKELHEQVIKSVKNGAKIACGGEIPTGDGYYYPATVLTNVLPGQPAYDDELFGPVASLIRAKDTDDAMRIANDSRFGLGGAIFSKDEDKAIELAELHFDTGMVFINKFGAAQPGMPFGGVKNSGYGREHGGFGLKEFINVKAINIL